MVGLARSLKQQLQSWCPVVTNDEVHAAVHAARRRVDATGYGHWVPDDLLMSVVKDSLEAAAKVRK